MDREGKVIELRGLDGGLILSFLVVEKPLQEKPKETKTNSQPNSQPAKGDKKSGNHDAFMTDAQKRYLFRLLAEQGKEGEVAHEYLKNLFQVKFLKDVLKLEASQAIERLLAGAKGGAAK